MNHVRNNLASETECVTVAVFMCTLKHSMYNIIEREWKEGKNYIIFSMMSVFTLHQYLISTFLHKYLIIFDTLSYPIMQTALLTV